MFAMKIPKLSFELPMGLKDFGPRSFDHFHSSYRCLGPVWIAIFTLLRPPLPALASAAYHWESKRRENAGTLQMVDPLLEPFKG